MKNLLTKLLVFPYIAIQFVMTIVNGIAWLFFNHQITFKFLRHWEHLIFPEPKEINY